MDDIQDDSLKRPHMLSTMDVESEGRSATKSRTSRPDGTQMALLYGDSIVSKRGSAQSTT